MSTSENAAVKVAYLSENAKESGSMRAWEAPRPKPAARAQNGLKVVTSHFVRRDFNKWLRFYALLDAVSLFMGFIFAWELTIAANLFLYSRHLNYAPLEGSHLTRFMVVSAGMLLWFHYNDHYRIRMPFWAEVKKIVCALGFAVLLDGFLQFASKQDFSRLWLVLGWVFAAGMMILLRNAFRSGLRARKLYQVPTLLIGGGETAKHTRSALRSEPCLGYEIVAQTRNLPLAFTQEGSSWQKLCIAYGVDYVIIALDGHELQEAEPYLAQLSRESVPFSISPPLRHLPVIGMVPQYFMNHDVLLLTRTNRLEHSFPCALKRAFDVAVSGSLLLLASPFLALIALLIKLDGGPAIFGHSRVGQNQKIFACLKFRSMVTDSANALKRHLEANPAARAEWDMTQKLRDDPRITKIGAFLRKTSLDELPQLINVLKGDMSLVGPRPIVTAEVTNYHHDIDHYYRVRPGITGMWQVSGRNDVTYAQRVQMDSWYVRNWSLWHDIAILFKTVPAVLQKKGAY